MPLSPPSPYHPSGSTQFTIPEHLSHASNLDWQSVSHLIIYMFQGCSLRSSHHRLLPQNPKSVLYICVSFSVLHIGLSISRDITLPTKVHLIKAVVLPVVMYGCESWTVKKAEHEKIDAFELWCWRRLLRVPCTARTSNQSILKEISLGCSLEGLMLKLKLQYFGHLMQRVDSLEKDPYAGRDWGQEEKWMTEDEMAEWHYQLDRHEFE